MSRLDFIEEFVAGTLATHNNLKLMVRGRPRFIDPQMNTGNVRFAIKRGFNFTGILPDNQSILSETAFKDQNIVNLKTRTGWFQIGSLVRVGESESVGELNIITDLLDETKIELQKDLIVTHDTTHYVSLVGVEAKYYLKALPPNQSKNLFIEVGQRVFPGDEIITAPTPEVLESLNNYTIKSVYLIGTRNNYNTENYTIPIVLPYQVQLTKRDIVEITVTNTLSSTTFTLTNSAPLSGQVFVDYTTGLLLFNSSDQNIPIEVVYKTIVNMSEPPVIYQYEITLDTQTGLLPFEPEVGLNLYLKAYPVYFTDNFASGGDTKIISNMGPFLFDAYYGDLIYNKKIVTKLGLQLWDAFGLQINADDPEVPEWKVVPSNYLVLERTISSDSLLFWQRIDGYFQYKKGSYFQAELNSEGKFTISTDLLVPKWPTDKQRGWVIPIIAQSPIRISCIFEPQSPQVFVIPSNTLTFIRPKILVDTVEITRLIITIEGSPNSKVEIRDWAYDGSAAESISYYILGTNEAFGESRWLAGGCSVKPLFYNLDILKARYSDGVSKYNSGYIYG